MLECLEAERRRGRTESRHDLSLGGKDRMFDPINDSQKCNFATGSGNTQPRILGNK